MIARRMNAIQTQPAELRTLIATHASLAFKSYIAGQISILLLQRAFVTRTTWLFLYLEEMYVPRKYIIDRASSSVQLRTPENQHEEREAKVQQGTPVCSSDREHYNYKQL